MKALVALTLLLLPIATACEDDSPREASPTSDSRSSAQAVPTTRAGFPIVLQHDSRITAEVDGSSFREEPVTPWSGPPNAVPSRDNSKRVFVRDGIIVVESRDGSEVTIDGVRPDGVNALWSPDGARFAFNAPSADGSGTLFVVNADGSGLVEVSQGLVADPAFPLAWSPDSVTLAFGIYSGDDRAPASDLYVVRGDGTQRRLLGEFLQPQGDAGWDRPRFSPDGAKIVAFSPTLSELAGLRVFETDAAAAHVEIPGTAVLKFSWSPDASQIAFDTYDAAAQRSSVRIADVATGSSTELVNGAWPRWSPDGSRIAFKSTAPVSGEQQVYVAPVGAGTPVAVGPPGNYAFNDVTWSNDGGQLIFTRPAFGPSQLYRVDLEAAAAPALGPTMGALGDPPQAVSVSPDGNRIAFFWNGTWSQYDLSSNEQTALTPAGFGTGDVFWTDAGPRIAHAGPSAFIAEPDGTVRDLGYEAVQATAFSPDGTRIAVLAQHRLAVIDENGANPVEIFSGLPETNIVQSVDWEPDGMRLSYVVTRYDNTSGETTTDAFVSDLERNAVSIADGASYAGLPYWSPDGHTLAQVRADGLGAFELWLSGDEGQDARLLTTFEGQACCDALHWSPDGALIAVTHDLGAVTLLDVTTGEQLRALTTGGGCSLRIAGWSQDGELYVFTACYYGI